MNWRPWSNAMIAFMRAFIYLVYEKSISDPFLYNSVTFMTFLKFVGTCSW